MSSDALVLRAKGQSYSNWPSDHILFFQEGRTEYHTHDVVNKPSTLQPRSEESRRQRNFAEEQAGMDFAAMLCTRDGLAARIQQAEESPRRWVETVLVTSCC